MMTLPDRVEATPSKRLRVNPLDLAGIISYLRTELEAIDEAIRSLERRAVSYPKRRSRPPKWFAKEGSDIERNGTTEGATMKTLLVLEHEAPVMKLLLHVLRHYTVLKATTAEQALRLFFYHARQIDLLVADATLPTSSGLYVALLLRAEIPNLPVILTSGYPLSNRDFADLERLGSTSVVILPKPFQPQVLSEAVRQLVGAPRSSAASTA
jgi:CheY-like chemotaxis protein